MSDKSTIIRAFNTHFFDFLDDIIGIFPTNNEIAVARNSFETIKKANPTAILKAWYKHVYTPYKEVIDKGDVMFFFEKDYGSDLAMLKNSNEIMNMIDKVREPLLSMNEVNTKHSAKYIQNLSQLSIVYNGLA
jgi:hypothetical protein